MVFYIVLRFSMVLKGFPWFLEVFSGSQWFSVVLKGFEEFSEVLSGS